MYWLRPLASVTLGDAREFASVWVAWADVGLELSCLLEAMNHIVFWLGF